MHSKENRPNESRFAQPFKPQFGPVSANEIDRAIQVRQAWALEYIAAQIGIIARRITKSN